MRFKIDENLSRKIADVLTSAGHDATTVGQEGLVGVADEDLAPHLVAEGRALVTLDLHFADTRKYPPQHYAGLVVIRSPRQDRPFLVRLVRWLLPLLASRPLAGRLWIVEPNQVRIRSGAEE